MKKNIENVILIILILIIHVLTFAKENTFQQVPPNQILKNISISPMIFNPSKSERVIIHYQLLKDSEVTLKIWDFNHHLIKTLIKSQKRKNGYQEEKWNGKDDYNTIVPDGVYYFTFITSNDEVKNFLLSPEKKTESEYIASIDYKLIRDPDSKEYYLLKYSLPSTSYVRIRAGIKEGPLYNTILNWEPRVAGEHVEKWDGKDILKTMFFAEHPQCTFLIEAITLPENTIITMGNRLPLGKYERKISKKVREINSFNLTNPFYKNIMFLKKYCENPKINISISNNHNFTKNNIKIINNKVKINLEMNKGYPKELNGERSEILIYFDHELFMEEEQGYFPYCFELDTTQYSNGEHILAVNVRLYNDNYGLGCKKVYILNQE